MYRLQFVLLAAVYLIGPLVSTNNSVTVKDQFCCDSLQMLKSNQT